MHIRSENWLLKAPGSPESINHPSLSGPSRPSCLHCVWSLAPDSNPARQVQQVQAGLSRCCSSGMQAPVVIKVKAIRQALYHAITCTVHQLCRQKCRARASAALNEASSEVPKYSDVLKYSPLPESGSVSATSSIPSLSI